MGSSRSRCPAMDLCHIPSGDDITSGEVLEYYSRQRSNIQGIHLDQVPRGFNLIVLRLSNGIGSLKPSPGDSHMIPHRLPVHRAIL